MVKKGKKICVLGAGNVGATIAYTLALDGTANEIVLVDINKEKAVGEAMDIIQGTVFTSPVNLYAGEYCDCQDADMVVVTVGMARKPGQTRLDLAQSNINIIKAVMPQIAKYAPDAIYVVVSNPVDILTYAIIKSSGIPESQIIGSGTLLDSARLRSRLAEHVGIPAQNVHAYVFGEHGDTAMIPWSLTTIAGMEMTQYCTNICENHNHCGKKELYDIGEDVRTAGAKVISLKGATYYAIAMTVRRICESVIRDSDSILTVSTLTNGRYGLPDVALSLPAVVGARGIERYITPPLTDEELQQLHKSANALRSVIDSLDI
ncbi:MAG: L-lactate dehydrogenase [Clostridia bacterium]|nr:L-lactate dehydrogenase [Clostridia bacterium]